MLESIERLRKAVIRWKGTETWETADISDEFNGYVDAIEREIAERYGSLPLNADEGVERRREFVRLDISMIPCGYLNGGKAPYYSIVYRENGDLFQGYSSFDIGTVSEYLRDYFIGQGRDASDKPDTVKELLKRMADEVYNDSHGVPYNDSYRVPFDRDFIVEKYANELYELQRQA